MNQRIVELLFGALARAVPDRVCAASGQWVNPIFGGLHPVTGRRFVFYDYVMAGVGARHGKDGIDAISPCVSVENIPVEAQEARNPIVVERMELITDSGGAGTRRGGLGIRKDIRLLAEETTLTNLTDRQRLAPYGLAGGHPGTLGSTILNPGRLDERPIHSKDVVQLRRGDVVSFRCSGSGGVGDPAGRDGAALADDVREGRVSPEAARDVYGMEVPG